ncbi:hypothetical protein BN175_520001 [Clostridioides difficile T23]|uniref:Uncharacterized protein n=1 Tax=Clostridioides difficile TaxID=1496 RepID=A0A069A6C0_CLODI|nr:hypothetical protein BN167_480001 [Clostridioides difficile E13]CCL05846.1 hypothetical protein BN168_260001 [Clostridioides difficile CD002]CCL09974.1 hypothetical protein BN169_510003 [Clostridioides difficile E16]CCL16560.1 hypothetical protein BN170_580001 [Clostridioides difficile T22]CCL20600.1 hypothetical protein BN171_700001 [Clostridioides difficile E25]CCL24836.1 hypothetical protein BN172_890001 [Clostridioides difficile T15]CCL28568.1 hypothetical protein BN173_580001 [Clostri
MPHGTEIALLGHAFIQLPQATHSFAKIFAYFFFLLDIITSLYY